MFRKRRTECLHGQLSESGCSVKGTGGADLERVDQLRREFEAEISRILAVIRRARFDIACAHDRLHQGLALEIFIERKAQERAE